MRQISNPRTCWKCNMNFFFGCPGSKENKILGTAAGRSQCCGIGARHPSGAERDNALLPQRTQVTTEIHIDPLVRLFFGSPVHIMDRDAIDLHAGEKLGEVAAPAIQLLFTNRKLLAQAGSIFTARGSRTGKTDHSIMGETGLDDMPGVIVSGAAHGSVAKLCRAVETNGKSQRALIFQRQLRTAYSAVPSSHRSYLGT